MYNYGKRLIDLLVSSLLLFILSPLFLLIALLIKLDSPGPAIFCQERVGLHGKLFLIFKFRTMILNAADIGSGAIIDLEDNRITRTGHFLRRYSLDELPQLLNILRGEMSLVGPRPTLAYQVQQYTERQLQRLQVKPGLTGWAQIKGRNSLSWPERIELDLWYVENKCLTIDLLILGKTVGVVLHGSGLYAEQEKFQLHPSRQNLIILGAGGAARETLQYVQDLNTVREQYHCLGFIDENPEAHGQLCAGLPILGDFHWFEQNQGQKVQVICGVGSPQVKERFVQLARLYNLSFATLIHPTAVVAKTVRLGQGVLIGPGSVVTADTVLGDHVSIHYNCTVGHDVTLGDFTTVLPGANISGSVRVGCQVLVGANSCILQNLRLGDQVTVGAGSVVTKNIPAHVTVTGVPAQVHKFKVH